MISIPREDVIVLLEAGYIYLAMKKYKEAKQVFEGVCALVPEHDVPQVALANLYFSQEKFLEAVRVLRSAVKDKPDSAYAHSHLGEAYLFYDKMDLAREHLEKASALEPQASEQNGEFARSLIKLMDAGYNPTQLRKASKKRSASLSQETSAE